MKQLENEKDNFIKVIGTTSHSFLLLYILREGFPHSPSTLHVIAEPTITWHKWFYPSILPLKETFFLASGSLIWYPTALFFPVWLMARKFHCIARGTLSITSIISGLGQKVIGITCTHNSLVRSSSHSPPPIMREPASEILPCVWTEAEGHIHGDFH